MRFSFVRRACAAGCSVALLFLVTPAVQAVDVVPGSEYSLAATVSPPPLTAADCAADSTCFAAPAPVGAGQDDYAALQQLIDRAAITPPSATVFLATGSYTLTKGLRLPPNVHLRGSGITATSLVMDPTKDWRNFNYGFLIRHNDIKQAGSSNLVSDLTVNGNCRTGAGAPVPADLPGSPGQDCDFRSALGAPTTVGGGIGVGDRWTVRQVRFTNLEYFKLWVHGSKDARIVDNRFDNWGGAESGNEDNVGGGGRNDGTIVEHNQFDKTIRGNSLDFTNAIRTTVRANTVHTDPAVGAARGDGLLYGNVRLEGVIQATVAENVLYGSQIALTSNVMYPHIGTTKDITNPRAMVVTGNRIIDSAYGGVLITYDDYRDADNSWGTLGTWETLSTDPADHVVRPGGGNLIRDNIVERPGRYGILVIGGTVSHAKDTADKITGNSVHNAGYGGASTTYAGFDTCGIGISIGNGDQIVGNSIVDDQANPTTWYGIHIGGRTAQTTPTNTVLADPPNTATGVIGSLNRYGAFAPQPPTGLVANGRTSLVWNESYPLAGLPVAGYRVYRDGHPVADLPVGSATIPGNLLSDAEAGFETDTAGWTPGSRTAIARNSGTGAIGAASLALTTTGAGQTSAYSRKIPATAGTTYTSVASFQAGSTARRIRAGIAFTTAAGVVHRLASSNTATVDATTGWMTSYYTTQAPAGTVDAQVFLMAENTAVGEVHLLDRAGLVAGTGTEQWTDPNAPAGPSIYQVVAYRAGDGENSTATTIAIP